MEALSPFRQEFKRPDGEPRPLAYLSSEVNSLQGALDVKLEVLIQTEAMRKAGLPSVSMVRPMMRPGIYLLYDSLVAK